MANKALFLLDIFYLLILNKVEKLEMKKLREHFVAGFIIHLCCVIVFFGLSAITSLMRYSDITHFLIHTRSGVMEIEWWQLYLCSLVVPVTVSIIELFNTLKKRLYHKKNNE